GLPGPMTLFAGFASDKTLLVAPGKDYLIDGLRTKADATKAPELKNKTFKELLAKLDDKQSLAFAAIIPPGLIKVLPAGVPDEVKDFLAKLSALSGGITLTDGIKLQITLATKEAADAKALKEKIDDGMNKAVGILALLAGQNKE